MNTIEQLQRENPALYFKILNQGIQQERDRVLSHVDLAMKYEAPMWSVRCAISNDMSTVNIEAVHDFYIEAADREERLAANW